MKFGDLKNLIISLTQEFAEEIHLNGGADVLIKSDTKNYRLLGFIYGLLAISVGYILVRYVFFHLHGMKEWPFDLFIFGVIILFIAMLFNKKIVTLATPIGYCIGFIIGFLFQRDGKDPGGGTTNSLWIIWTISYLVMILIGGALEVILRKKSNK